MDPIAGIPLSGIGLPRLSADGDLLHLFSVFLPLLSQLLLLSLLPVALGVLSSYRESFRAYVNKKWAMFRHEHVRTIEFLASTDYYATLRSDNRNNVLQKAITLYVSSFKEHPYVNGLISLVEPAEHRDGDDDDGNSRVTGKRSSEALRKMHMSTMPFEDTWEELEDGVYLNHHARDEPAACFWDRSTMFTFVLRTAQRHGDKVIDRFLSKCMDRYTALLRKQEDKARYLYQLQLGMSKIDDHGARPPVFKRYKLSDEKTFDSLFLPHKNETLRLIDDFLQRRGKFAIEGFPQKLGLLLHGPPGCGKTSFVKALATYSNRHIVSVPLGKITTNQELYDIMFERVFPCVGDDGIPQRLSFDEVIFLIEEIDAATDIVKSRKTKPHEESSIQKAESCVFEALSTPSRAGELVKHHDEKKPVEEAVTVTATSTAKDSAMDALLVNLTGGDNLLDEADKLDLAGLLNVLDGVVDSPGRVVIITTNHPERLDAALIRPGRINSRLLFTFIREKEMVDMLSHHYGPLTAVQTEVLSSILASKQEDELLEGDASGFCMTPAEVEQLCAEADTIEEFFASLRKFPDFSLQYDY